MHTEIAEWVAERRSCLDGACRIRRGALWPGWLPLVLLPLAVLPLRSLLSAWLFMWLMAFALFAGCKWLTFWCVVWKRGRPKVTRSLGYLWLWPGMDAEAFLSERAPLPSPTAVEWTRAAGKTVFGAALVWGVVRFAALLDPLLTGWIGLCGLVFLFHFGSFHLVALAWRSWGVNGEPIMRAPLRSRSLAEFWGRRWNTAFNLLVKEFLFRPLCPAVGAKAATLLVFMLSGLVHELVISLPACGGYGLPTIYFVLQGAGLLAERSRIGHVLGLGIGWRGWLFTLVLTAGPAFALFHAPFVHNVMLPFLKTIGAY